MKLLRKTAVLVSGITVFILFSRYVAAQNLASALTPILKDILSIASLYDAVPQAIDFIMYTIFFISFFRFAFSRVEAYKDQANSNAVKAMYISLGLIASFGLTLLEIRTGVTLKVLGPYFGFLFFIFLALLTYNFFGKSPLSAGLILLVLWALMGIVFAPWFVNLQNNFFYTTVLGLCEIIGIILTVIGITRVFQGKDENPLNATSADRATTGSAAPATPPKPGKRDPAAIQSLQGEIAALGTDIGVFGAAVTAMPGAPPVPASPALVTHVTGLNAKATQILTKIRAVQTNAQFRNLPGAEQAAFTALVTNFTLDYGTFASFCSRM